MTRVVTLTPPLVAVTSTVACSTLTPFALLLIETVVLVPLVAPVAKEVLPLTLEKLQVTLRLQEIWTPAVAVPLPKTVCELKPFEGFVVTTMFDHTKFEPA